MIEIIKPGKIKIYKGTCSQCECEFKTADINDIDISINDGWLSYSCKCPCCGTVTRMIGNKQEIVKE